jgi:hypothetical protein
MASNNIVGIKTRTDPWQEAMEALAKEHKIHSVDNTVLLTKILDSCPTKNEYALDPPYIIGDKTHRRLRIMDKHDRVILDIADPELVDSKIYVRIPYRPRVSWFNWMFSRFYMPRTPSVNVNVRR